jgi:hypothetical protein
VSRIEFLIAETILDKRVIAWISGSGLRGLANMGDA